MELMGVKMEAVKIMVDNQSAIMLSKTSAHHNRTKHIDTRYHFIRDCVKDGRVVIEHVGNEFIPTPRGMGHEETQGGECGK